MNNEKTYLGKLSAAIALLSVSLIAFELTLIRILSIVQWYHFAYMVISVALLGFGAAGTIIAVFKKSLIEKTEILFPSEKDLILSQINHIITNYIVSADDIIELLYEYKKKCCESNKTGRKPKIKYIFNT